MISFTMDQKTLDTSKKESKQDGTHEPECKHVRKTNMSK